MRFLLAAVAVLVGVGQVEGALVQWSVADGGNGHWYEYRFGPDNWISWHQAKVVTESMTLGGVSGHLVTLTSQAESDFVVQVMLDTFDGEGVWGMPGLALRIRRCMGARNPEANRTRRKMVGCGSQARQSRLPTGITPSRITWGMRIMLASFPEAAVAGLTRKGTTTEGTLLSPIRPLPPSPNRPPS